MDRTSTTRQREAGALTMATPPQMEQDLAVGGIRLHYAWWTQPAHSGRTVLLVHGLTAHSRAWAAIGPALAARGYTALAPDLRGRGRSDKPPHGYGVARHAADLLALCDGLGLGTVHLVGHALGAVIALYLAAVHPERVDRLVLVDMRGQLPVETAQAIAASVAELDRVYPSLEAYLAAMRRVPVAWGPFWEACFRYGALVHRDGTVTAGIARTAIAEELAALEATPIEPLAARVQQPTLIVRPALGTLGPERGQVLTATEAERWRARIPRSEVVVVPETNHYSILLSGALVETVAAFLPVGH
jgi:pimeloyl-ACP methyl ester carboxylesterase